MKGGLFAGALAVAVGGCVGGAKEGEAIEPRLAGLIELTLWLDGSICDKSPYGRPFRGSISTEPTGVEAIAGFEAYLDEARAIGVPPGELSLEALATWDRDGPAESNSDNQCGCFGSADISLDPGETLDLAVPVSCTYVTYD